MTLIRPVLACPLTHAILERVALDDAVAELGPNLAPAGDLRREPPTHVWTATDLRWAYPERDGIPMLMAPERLFPEGEGPVVDLSAPPWSEAWEEMATYGTHYPSEVRQKIVRSEAALLADRSALPDDAKASWPEPMERWAGAGTHAHASWIARRHLAPLVGKHFLQVGGTGMHALTMLALGAESAVAVSPVLEEALLCREIAEASGLSDRLVVACAIAEQLPLASNAVDRVFVGSVMHHTVTSQAFPETARVLRPGGRFASVDVYESPLYGLGIRVFGKKQRDVHCLPMTQERLAPSKVFEECEISYHGAVLSYPMTVMQRLGRPVSAERSRRWTQREDRWARQVPALERLASVVVVRGTAGGPASPV